MLGSDESTWAFDGYNVSLIHSIVFSNKKKIKYDS